MCPMTRAPLLPVWQATLEARWIFRGHDAVFDGRLIFEGNGLSAGQVAALPLQDNGNSRSKSTQR